MKVIVDAMGGDYAPDEIVKGAIEASKDFGVEIALVGRGEEILKVIERMGLNDIPDNIEIVNASEIITMEDDPSNIIRIKKDSSLAVGLYMLRDDRGDALVSAGNTGAILSGATLIVKRVRGVKRAALALLLPNSAGGYFVLNDAGANAECTPEQLLQFAYMGTYYAQVAFELDTLPTVGLLSNGEERTKGTSTLLEAYNLLEEAGRKGSINFIGNVEAKKALKGGCDVLVSDGFSGNVFLKTIEGTASLLLNELKQIYTKNIITKISALLVKKHVVDLKMRLNPDSVGGSIMLGISKPVIKAHGASNATAIYNAIHQGIMAAESDMTSSLLKASMETFKNPS
jgi:glycerol-3-phosphate acyltransferase PlsX